MFKLIININNVQQNDSNIFYKYCNNKLNEFKQQLLNNIDYTKFKLRFDYLIDNNILQFHNDNIMNDRMLIQLIVNSFRIYKRIDINGTICISYNIPDYILIPNSNMSITHFIRYIEYGDENIPPYKWITHCWYYFSQNLNKEWINFYKLQKLRNTIRRNTK